MSEFFSDKNYNEYFEKLNKQVTSQGKDVKPSRHQGTSEPRRRKKIRRRVYLRRRFLAIFLVVTVLTVVILSSRGCKKQEAPTENKGVIVEKKDEEPVKKTEKIVYTATEKTAEIPQTNDAKTGIVVRLSDKKIIAERGSDTRIYPASTLKIMTLLTAVELIENLDDTFTMTYEITDPLYVADASVAGFLNGEKVKLRDMLYGMILPSGADAAMGLAVKLAGSEEAFVKLMNEKVRQMGLKNTHFTNVTGLFNEENYSSAYDMAVITQLAYENEICRQVLSTYQYTTEKTPQNPDGIKLSSTLFSYMYGDEPVTAKIWGGKTGYVNEAGYCVATFGKNIDETEEYIVVTMGNSSKWPAFYGQIDLYKAFAK